jgi:hypothetical protein
MAESNEYAVTYGICGVCGGTIRARHAVRLRQPPLI